LGRLHCEKLPDSGVGVRSRIESGCIIDNSLLMGADFTSPLPKTSWTAKTAFPGIGANTTVRRAIIDKTHWLQRSNY